MTLRKPLSCLSLIVLLFVSQQSHAFDGNRKGFLLSLGFGAHGSDIADESESGLATTFKIGLGLTNNFTLYYGNYQSWFNQGGYLYGSALTGIGAAYYFSPRRPSFYITGIVGYASIDAIENDDDNAFNSSASGDGGGVGFGFGFELPKLLALEAMLIHSTIDYDNTFIAEQDHTSVSLTANFMFY